MSNTLTGLTVSNTYGRLVQVVGGLYYDGIGNLLNIGAGVSWQGSWDPMMLYFSNDVVSYNNGSYICILDLTPGGSPYSPPDIDTSHWSILVLSATGSNGTSGTSGTSGTDGPTGATGSTGTSGTSGVDGTSGTSGTDGPTGATGSTGTSGTSGVDGTSGTDGPTGATGSTGTSGTSGVDGTSGTDGPTGATGSTGTSGTSGVDGVGGGMALTLTGARASTNSTNVYLRSGDGLAYNVSPLILPYNGKIEYISISTSDISTWIGEVRNNGTPITGATISITAGVGTYSTFSVDIDEGALLQLYCNGSSVINPRMLVLITKR